MPQQHLAKRTAPFWECFCYSCLASNSGKIRGFSEMHWTGKRFWCWNYTKDLQTRTHTGNRFSITNVPVKEKLTSEKFMGPGTTGIKGYQEKTSIVPPWYPGNSNQFLNFQHSHHRWLQTSTQPQNLKQAHKLGKCLWERQLLIDFYTPLASTVVPKSKHR